MSVIRQQAVERKKMFVGGKWLEGTGKTFEVFNPATEEVIAVAPDATEIEVGAAVTAARAALEEGPWGRMSARERGRLIYKLAQRISEKAEELARLESLNNGKPLFESSRVDLPSTVECFEYYAGWADKIEGETIPVSGPYLNYTLREPVGVVGAIVPWNFPLLLAAYKIAPALACGNTVILKPAEETPLTALRLGELAQEVGFPEGVFNVITGLGPSTGAALVRHPGVDKIAFTGSTSTGQEIMRAAAGTLKKVSLELGGKSPNVVFADADLDAAVKGAVSGIFYGKGEVCTAGSRLLVEEKIHGQFMEKLVERSKKLTPGDPFDSKTRLGPLVSKVQMERVLGYIDSGKADGAPILTGGKRASVGNGKGYFVEATVFDKVDQNMKIAQEEIFGPVLATLRFESLEEAIQKANATVYGLAAGIWTKDVKKAHAFAKGVKAGTVWINTYGDYDAAAPFGGYKMSGFGRDLGKAALEAYTQTKTVWVNLG
ncbi:MAG: aldehyde dehydrogenase family protein [candidate division Zixibacteria bacterium]|nr:aldehyde dehydrogenase family protein [candidate division Zixibacteria bacterium]